MKKVLIVFFVILAVVIAGVSIAYPIILSKRGSLTDIPDDAGLTAGLSREAAQSARASGVDARIMTVNLLAHYEGFGGTEVKPRAKIFIEMLKAYSPDVVGLQEMCDDWYCCIRKNEGSYKMLRPLMTGAFLRMTTIIYNSDTLKLIKSGEAEFENNDDARTRRVVWGVFENLTTGVVFAVTNTHLGFIRLGIENEDSATIISQANEQIKISKDIYEEYNCPVVTIGDFNAKERDTSDNGVPDSSPIYRLLADNFTDVKNTAKRRIYGSQKDFDNTSNDHIFLRGEAEVARFSLLSQNYLTKMSDHYPLFADFIFAKH